MVQTDLVVDRILQKNAGLRIDRKIIETTGDTSKGRSMFSLEQRGILDKDVDQQILEGRVDFAVHNMKDVPIIDRSNRLVIASVPERGSQQKRWLALGICG
jgi:hydroxymethylbilane synthase